MAKFQFKILTGANEAACKAKYDALAIETSTGSGIFRHDPYTFYLFDKGGVGYLGDTPLFGGDASKFNMISSNLAAADLKPNTFYFVTADCTITDSTNSGTAGDTTGVHTAKQGSIWVTNGSSIPNEMSWNIFQTYIARYIVDSAIHSDGTNLPTGDTWDETFSGNDTSILTSGATKALINSVINAQAILSISFFKDVEPHTITAAEVTAGEITCFVDSVAGTSHTADIEASDHAGDFGLVFFCQLGPDDDDGDDTCVFVNLHNLMNLYVGSTSDTTEVAINTDSSDPSGHTQKIVVNVNKSEETLADFVQKIFEGIDTVVNHIEDDTLPNYDSTTAVASGGHGMSPNKFITESQLANILAHTLAYFAQVTYNTGEAGGAAMEEEEEEIG